MFNGLDVLFQLLILIYFQNHEFFKANQKWIEILNLGTQTAHIINKELQRNNSNSMNIIMEEIEVSREGWNSDKKTIQSLGMRLHHTEKRLKKLQWTFEKINKLNNQLQDGFISSRYVLYKCNLFFIGI